MLKNHPNGTYLECGSNDGIAQSNTYRLEKELGWSGVLVEASFNGFEKCIKNRSDKNVIINGALTAPENEGSVIRGDFDGHLMGSIGGTRRKTNSTSFAARGMTLGSVLKNHGVSHLDLMVIDLEGFELDALRGMDWSYCKPTLVVVEINGDVDPITQFLGKVGYYRTTNLSKFSKENNPAWDGTHNDYLFERVSDVWA